LSQNIEFSAAQTVGSRRPSHVGIVVEVFVFVAVESVVVEVRVVLDVHSPQSSGHAVFTLSPITPSSQKSAFPRNFSQIVESLAPKQLGVVLVAVCVLVLDVVVSVVTVIVVSVSVKVVAVVSVAVVPVVVAVVDDLLLHVSGHTSSTAG
jgi:hypothetical protein